MGGEWWREWRAAAAMLAVQLVATGLQILSRAILMEGAFVLAVITYRHLIAALCVAPFALFLERGREKKMGWEIMGLIFLCSLTGITLAMGMFYYGMKETNATFAAGFLNLVPIFAFAFSVTLRMEGLKLGTLRGRVKLIGALVCAGGALTISLYKGILLLPPHHSLLHQAATTTVAKIDSPNWTLGTLLLLGSCLSYAAWFIVQAKLLKKFPFKYTATLLTCSCGSIQSAVLGLCLDRSKQAWQLKLDMQLITIIYSGVLASALTFYLIAWTVERKGPSYAPIFNPLGLIFIAAGESVFLGAQLRSGSLLGMLAIVVGLYAFLWGRRSDATMQPLPKAVVRVVDDSRVVLELGEPKLATMTNT